MVSAQLPTAFPILKSSLHFPHSLPFLKPCSSSAGKRIGMGRNLECFSPACPIPKFRLAAASYLAAESGIDEENSVMPKHVAVIIDGHAKWARSRGLTVDDAHRVGIMTKLKYTVSHFSNLGIKLLTIYVFSTNNWKRPKMEVDFLMTSFEDFIRLDVKELITQHDIRFSVIGNKSRLPESLRDAIACAEEASHANKGMHFILALSYGGRNDIVEATKQIASKVEDGILGANDVDETTFEKHLMTRIAEFPNPDLLIKTGGELRLSDFYLWQIPFTEFYFSDTLFPDFSHSDILEALASYQARKRGFGLRL